MHVFPIVEHYIEHATFPKAGTGRLLLKKTIGGFEKIGKSIGDSGGKLSKKLDVAGDKLSKMGKKTIKKVGDTGGDVSKKLDLPPAYSKIDNVADTAGDVTKKIDNKNVKKLMDGISDASGNPSKFKKFISNNYGFIIGATTLGAIAAAAAITSEKINKTDYTIISIKKDSTDPSKTIITYTPEDMFTKRDSIMISSSNSNPHIDGEYPIQPLRGGSLRIDKTISKEGNYGIMKCYTSVSNQTTQTITDLTKPVTTTVGGVAGGVVGDIVGDVIPETFKSMGLGGLGNVPAFSWIACVFCIIILSMLLMLVIVI
jgi:outer membrane lipoprotein SlyB